MVKMTYLEKLKKYRKDKDEAYAKSVMEKPEKTNILKLFHPPGVVLILGSRRGGKTGLAHKIAEDIHRSRDWPAMVHLPPSTPDHIRKNIEKLTPSYMKTTLKHTEWEKKSVVIFDEAAQSAHARRTQSGDAVELDNLIGISGQRDQLLIFICHHTRKLDPNVVREVNFLVWKRPTYAYQLFERDELTDFTMKAFDHFAELRNGRKLNDTIRRMLKRNSLVLDMDDFKFYSIENNLPSYWTEDLSNLFENINKVGRKAPGY